MFDPKSDYALNRIDPDAIVCKSVTGVHIRLTRKDFSSDEEFTRWKEWSDGDYHDRVKAGRNFYDNGIPLREEMDSVGLSAEDVLMAPLLEQEEQDRQSTHIQKIKEILTEKQFRRLWLLYVERKSITEIAKLEGVTPQAIYFCLANAAKAIVNIL